MRYHWIAIDAARLLAPVAAPPDDASRIPVVEFLIFAQIPMCMIYVMWVKDGVGKRSCVCQGDGSCTQVIKNNIRIAPNPNAQERLGCGLELRGGQEDSYRLLAVEFQGKQSRSIFLIQCVCVCVCFC